MGHFRYLALDAEGQKQRGTVASPTESGARHQLVERHLNVVKLKARKRFREIEVVQARVKPTDVGAFSRQLAAFLRAGIPILDGVDTIAQEVRDTTFRRILAEMADDLRGGGSLSETVQRFARHFPSYYPGIVRSAEHSGNLAEVLERLSEYVDRDHKTRRRVRSALTYPAILLVLSIMTVVVLVGFVLPKFTDFFASFDAELPFTTRLLIDLGDLVREQAVILGAGAAVVVAAVAFLAKHSRGAGIRHRLLLRVPFVREVVVAAITERFCRILAAMLRSGVPIDTALESAIESCDNRVWERRLQEAAERTLRGEGLAAPLAATKLLPPTVVQMVRVGEETGTLVRQLEVAADHYEDELTARLDRLTTVFEPAVVVFMGLVVGFVAVALVSAMYGIYGQTDFGGGT